MTRYEYKLVKMPRGSWFSFDATQAELLAFLNREGRDGWRVAPFPPNLIGWRVLLEREVTP